MSNLVFIEPEPFIIDGRILDNITLSKKEDDSKEKIERIFRKLGYRPFWRELPRGIETVVTSSQDNILSNGQRQLVEWSRWIYHQPANVYLLDEPLSGVVRDVKISCLRALKEHIPDSVVVLTTQDPDLIGFSDYLIRFTKTTQTIESSKHKSLTYDLNV